MTKFLLAIYLLGEIFKLSLKSEFADLLGQFLSGFDRHISRSKTANLFAVYLKLFLWRGNTELRMLKTRRKLTVKRRNSLRYFDVHTHINLSLFLSQIFYSSFRSSKTKVKRNDCNACFFFAPSANFTRTSAVSVNFL